MSTLELRARLREKTGSLAEMKVKALAPASTPEDRAVLKGLLAEINSTEEQLDLAEQAEAIEAKAAKPAETVKAEPPQPQQDMYPLPAEPKRTGQMIFTLVGAALVKARHEHNPETRTELALKHLESEGYAGLANKLRQIKASNTLVSAEGGILVPTVLEGSIFPLLRVQSTFLAAGPRRVELTSGRFTLPRGLTGATASYIAEGALKPVSTPTFDSMNMVAKKLAGIVPMTNESVRWTVGNLEEYIRDDLRGSMAVTMDLNAWLGTGAGASPTGILNKAGVQTVTPTFAAPTAPTLAEIDTFANSMILKLTTAKLYANPDWRWVMSYRTALKLSTMRVGASDGDAAFPEIAPLNMGGRWKGFPVTVSSQIPVTGGVSTEETTLALVDFSQVLFGEEQGLVMKTSDQATLDTSGAGALVHLWQQNMFAILAESLHDFGLRTPLAVVKATIRW